MTDDDRSRNFGNCWLPMLLMNVTTLKPQLVLHDCDVFTLKAERAMKTQWLKQFHLKLSCHDPGFNNPNG
jgi:hypothetical protein